MQRSKMRLHDVPRQFFQVAFGLLCRNYAKTECALHEAAEPTGSAESAQRGT